MAELDKKISQKTQTDLVQSVLEAQEKRNQERVDMLVTNAIKQLKMSRFKPDQTTCISLAYLARISPQVFLQSSAIKEVLKSLLRRDNGPTNIKGTKNDIVLPVLAANILLACCDNYQNRAIILHKIDQWLSANSQKTSELIQHLLATICMKCQADQQTIGTLIEMRHHWLQYLDDNYELYGSVPSQLCANVRKLLHSETSCESLIVYLQFLIKHDADIDGLSKEISRFVIERPISMNSMLGEKESGIQLSRMILKIFIKLFTHLKSLPAIEPVPVESVTTATIAENKEQQQQSEVVVGDKQPESKQDPSATKGLSEQTSVKLEPKVLDSKPNVSDMKPPIATEPSKLLPNLNRKINSETQSTQQTPKSEDENGPQIRMIIPLYVKLPECSRTVVLNRHIIEAVLTLLALVDENEDCREEFTELLECWLVKGKGDHIATIYEDFGLTAAYNLPDKLRQRLVHSSNGYLMELGLRGANTAQLIRLLQQFGSPMTTINNLFKRLKSIKDVEQIRSEIKDASYFNQLLGFYSEMGALGASELQKRLDQTLS